MTCLGLLTTVSKLKSCKVFKVVNSFELEGILQSNFHPTLFKTKGTGSTREEFRNP